MCIRDSFKAMWDLAMYERVLRRQFLPSVIINLFGVNFYSLYLTKQDRQTWCVYTMILEVFYLLIFYVLLNLNITCEQHFACIYLWVWVLSILLCLINVQYHAFVKCGFSGWSLNGVTDFRKACKMMFEVKPFFPHLFFFFGWFNFKWKREEEKEGYFKHSLNFVTFL